MIRFITFLNKQKRTPKSLNQFKDIKVKIRKANTCFYLPNIIFNFV